jgi:hypothetical protein
VFGHCCGALLYVIFAIAILVVVPESRDEGLFGLGFRAVFLAYWPLFYLIPVAFIVLGGILARHNLRCGLPPSIAASSDPDERLRGTYFLYTRHVMSLVTSASWVAAMGMLWFAAAGSFWPVPLAAGAGLATMASIFPTERRWQRFLRSMDDR